MPRLLAQPALPLLPALLALLCLFAPLPTFTTAKQIALPQGAQPEGVTHAAGSSYFAADLRSGAVFLVDTATGLVTTAVPRQANRTALGMSTSQSGTTLFVAGGGAASAETPVLLAYDVATGATVAACPVRAAAFVNDVFTDHRFAYFTDSFRPFVYRLRLRDLPSCRVRRIPLPLPAFAAQVGVFKANGIVAYGGGLIVANTALATLFFIDLANGGASQRLLPEGTLLNPDGLDIQHLRRRQLLYVAQNVQQLVSVWSLCMVGRVVSLRMVRKIKSKSFEVPTTVAVFGRRLVVANSRFSQFTPRDPLPPGEQFSVGVVNI